MISNGGLNYISSPIQILNVFFTLSGNKIQLTIHLLPQQNLDTKYPRYSKPYSLSESQCMWNDPSLMTPPVLTSVTSLRG